MRYNWDISVQYTSYFFGKEKLFIAWEIHSAHSRNGYLRTDMVEKDLIDVHSKVSVREEGIEEKKKIFQFGYTKTFQDQFFSPNFLVFRIRIGQIFWNTYIMA